MQRYKINSYYPLKYLIFFAISPFFTNFGIANCKTVKIEALFDNTFAIDNPLVCNGTKDNIGFLYYQRWWYL